MTTLKYGSKGDLVKALQYILKVDADGKFGNKTKAAVIVYQKSKSLSADGVVGANTWNAILSDAPTLRSGAASNWVYALESLLQTMKLDGKYESDEVQHVKSFQKTNNLGVDGIVGRKTWGRLLEIDALAVSGGTSTTTGTNTKQPVDYKQYDSRWGSVVYTKNNTHDKSQTIKNSGCGPTAAADIVATWFDKSVTPKTLAAYSVANGYRTDNSGTAWGFFKSVAKKYGASNFVQTSSYATAEAAIKNGCLVVCSVGPGIWTKGGHFICWWKVDDKYVYINDPASSASNRAKSAKSNLKSQAKQYFIFYK